MRTHFRTAILGLLWICAVGIGQRITWRYETNPGTRPPAPVEWPTDSSVSRSPGLPTLVMLAHPQCACTHASLEELNVLMARCHGRVNATVLFFKPYGAAADWNRTALWRNAFAIPGVNVLSDEGGQEARRFHVLTSGQVNLYDAQGRLLFSGGITGTRGHEGDNPGVEAIQSLVLTGKGSPRRTPVFGCALLGPETPTVPAPPLPTLAERTDGATRFPTNSFNSGVSR